MNRKLVTLNLKALNSYSFIIFLFVLYLLVFKYNYYITVHECIPMEVVVIHKLCWLSLIWISGNSCNCKYTVLVYTDGKFKLIEIQQ